MAWALLIQYSRLAIPVWPAEPVQQMSRTKTLTEMLSEVEGAMASQTATKSKSAELQCSYCSVQTCKTHDLDKAPAFCPTRTHEKILERALDLYNKDPEIHKIALAATHVTTHTMKNKWTRVEDTIEFAKSFGAKKIGIATCGGLISESKILSKILEAKGFEVVSVSCKCGSVPKEDIGVPESDRGSPEKFEAICNPVAQAKLLNHDKTDLNILLGLCVGHDALFLQQSKAPTTVLVAKDRVTFHNPAAPLYGTQSYYRHLLKP
jgi:uncharacterized metal-binding protein